MPPRRLAQGSDPRHAVFDGIEASVSSPAFVREVGPGHRCAIAPAWPAPARDAQQLPLPPGKFHRRERKRHGLFIDSSAPPWRLTYPGPTLGPRVGGV